MTEYTEGTCEYCSGTGLRDAETLCPTCNGSGGRIPIVEASEIAPDPAPALVAGASEFTPAEPDEPATGGI